MRLDWSKAVEDISSVPSDVIKLRLVSNSKGLEKLALFTRLKSLWCFNVNPKSLGHICGCASLEDLFVEAFKSDSFNCLSRLTSLKVLSIDSCSKVNSLRELSGFQDLEGLNQTL